MFYSFTSVHCLFTCVFFSHSHIACFRSRPNSDQLRKVRFRLQIPSSMTSKRLQTVQMRSDVTLFYSSLPESGTQSEFLNTSVCQCVRAYLDDPSNCCGCSQFRVSTIYLFLYPKHSTILTLGLCHKRVVLKIDRQLLAMWCSSAVCVSLCVCVHVCAYVCCFFSLGVRMCLFLHITALSWARLRCLIRCFSVEPSALPAISRFETCNNGAFLAVCVRVEEILHQHTTSNSASVIFRKLEFDLRPHWRSSLAKVGFFEVKSGHHSSNLPLI